MIHFYYLILSRFSPSLMRFCLRLHLGSGTAAVVEMKWSVLDTGSETDSNKEAQLVASILEAA